MWLQQIRSPAGLASQTFSSSLRSFACCSLGLRIPRQIRAAPAELKQTAPSHYSSKLDRALGLFVFFLADLSLGDPHSAEFELFSGGFEEDQ